MTVPVPASHKKFGRPSLLTAETKARLLMAFELPHAQDDCARLAGISPRTLSKWLTRGRRATHGEYFDLVRDIELAIAKAKDSLITRVMTATRRRPDIALKVLARRWPYEWGPAAPREAAEPAKRPDMAAVRAKIEAKLDEIEQRMGLAADLERDLAAGPDLRRIADTFHTP
jgi:hypothetical protein